MKSYFKLIITTTIFLSIFTPAQAREYTVNEFIDDFVSKPFSLTDGSEDRFFDAQNLLCKISKSELRFIRNAIFARHGYIFKDPVLRDYFGSKIWYKPVITDVSEIDLSDKEVASLNYIKDLESDPSFDDFLKLFKKSKLPITTKPRQNATRGKDYLPPQYFIKYFKKCPGIHPYYQQNLIYQNANFVAITYAVSVPAGAGYDAYQLVTFTPKGELIDEMRLGSSGGEIGGSWSFTALINEKYEIRVRDISIEDNDSGQGQKVFYVDTIYTITNNGRFKELSKTKSESSR